MNVIKSILVVGIVLYAAAISYLHFFQSQERQGAQLPEQNAVVTPVSKNKKVENLQITGDKNQSSAGVKKALSSPKEKEPEVTYTKAPKRVPNNALVVTLPKVPKVEAKVPKVITVGSPIYHHHDHKRLSTTLHQPKPKAVEPKSSKASSAKAIVSDLGEDKLGRVATYLQGAYLESKGVIELLKKGGYEILSTTTLDSKNGLEVIVFTDPKIKSLAQHSPFLASMRVLVDKKDHLIKMSNPLYFAKAFSGKQYDEKSALEVLHHLTQTFHSQKLKESRDRLKSTLIAKYQFMFGMPYYGDMESVGEGSKEALIKKARAKKRVAFVVDLGKGRALLGMNLSPKTTAFIHNVGEKNALLLPYPVLIEEGEAKILNPKYYIAISYPMLKMSQFMKISDIPDAITAEAQALFR